MPAGLGAGAEFARHANWHWQGTRGVRKQERAAAARRRGDWRGPVGGCAHQLACLSRAGMRRPGHSTQRFRPPMAHSPHRVATSVPSKPCRRRHLHKRGAPPLDGPCTAASLFPRRGGSVSVRTSSSLRAAKGTVKLVVGRQARQEAPIARRVAVLEQRMGGRKIGCCGKLSELENCACTGCRNWAAAAICARGAPPAWVRCGAGTW